MTNKYYIKKKDSKKKHMKVSNSFCKTKKCKKRPKNNINILLKKNKKNSISIAVKLIKIFLRNKSRG